MEINKEVELGSEADLKLSLVEGKAKLEVLYSGKGGSGGAHIELDAEYFLDKVAEAIPGPVDDAIIAALKLGLKA